MNLGSPDPIFVPSPLVLREVGLSGNQGSSLLEEIKFQSFVLNSNWMDPKNFQGGP